MATAKRTSTRRAAPAKSGAAPAVPANAQDTVESDTPLVVDSNTNMSEMERAENEADAEDARQQAQAKADEAAVQAEALDATRPARVEDTEVGSTVPDNEPPKITEGVYGPGGTREEPVATRDLVGTETAGPAADEPALVGEVELADPEADSPSAPVRDLEVLKALADTSGRDPVTPYGEGGVPAPSPVKVMPVLRDTHDWTREGDIGAVGRVLPDGIRMQVNGYYRFARRGDRIVAPTDVIDLAVKRGTMLKEG